MTDWHEVSVEREAHLRELVDMYEEPGLGIHLEEIKLEEVEQCTQLLQENGEKICRGHARHKPESQG